MYTLTNDDKIDWNVKGSDRVLQNVKNLLRLRTYQLPYARTRGVDSDVIDLPFNVLKPVLESEVDSLISELEPRVNLLSVKVLTPTDSGEYSIEVGVDFE